MANRIKGITVQIGGDTTKLDKALSEVNQTLRTTQADLNDVNRLLKLDPKNVTLLAQKQKALTKAIEETKKKLTTLKTAADQASDALAQGTITSEQYDALQREIVQTTEALRVTGAAGQGNRAKAGGLWCERGRGIKQGKVPFR